jgi:hypothetical protein
MIAKTHGAEALERYRQLRVDPFGGETGLKDLDAAIANAARIDAETRQATAALREAEVALRRADERDLADRAAAEVAGKPDPGPVHATNAKAELERLTDRHRVLRQAQTNAQDHVAQVVRKHREPYLDATGRELAKVQGGLGKGLDALERALVELERLQVLRGQLATFPERVATRPTVGERTGAELVAELRELVAIAQWPVPVPEPEPVQVRGEGDRRYAEVNG